MPGLSAPASPQLATQGQRLPLSRPLRASFAPLFWRTWRWSWLMWRLVLRSTTYSTATHQGLALLSGLFRLAQAATLGLNLLMLFLVLQLLTGDVFAAAMGAESANALAYLFLTAHGIGYNLALVFFAFSILIQGYLFIKSDLFPGWLGFLVIAASLTYFVYTLASFFMPTFDAYAGGFEMMLVAVALPVELAVTIWLLVRGVKGSSVTVENMPPSYAEAVSKA